MAPINITQLKILLVDHSQEGKASLIKLLRAQGISQICAVSNGTELLAQVNELQADLIIFGFDLGDALRATDLLRYMIRSNILPTWIPVAFVTEQPEQVLADLPFRILPTPVLAKPVSESKLLALLKQSVMLINATRPLLKACHGEHCQFAGTAILETPTEKLPVPIKDVVLTLKIMSLMQNNQVAQARTLALQISNEQRRFEWLLNLVYAQGDAEELLKLQQQLQQANLLPQKRLLYQMRMLQQRQQLKSMLALCESMHDNKRTPNEINLKATLLFMLQGYDAADQYLSAKSPSRQDPYAINLLLIWRITLVLLQSLQQPDARTLKTSLMQFSGQLRWDQGAIDFGRFADFTQLAIKAMDNQPEVNDALTRLQLQAGDFDVFQCLLLTYLAIKMAHPSASLWLFRADSKLAQMHISAERLSAGIIHGYLFEHIFAQQDAKSAVYNHWGRKYVQLKQHYRALNMFYKAWRCSPDIPRYPLNLLHSMQGLGLEQFWGCDQQQLQQHLQSLVLTDKEKSSLKKISA
ncbi:response regulator [Lacimicrobium alkaliphilum]|uniref:Response regulatory domain-containing protein n=1 Tax=Lacimicrobium alkaliphilum TaxID=1526571 RepID=A0A0U2ZG06_9ALTE|nr:response regulator [Lacimicrobium alkaliphilum]ALS97959.1 hypothetical protein AT746_06555 [Lacimicrobium alkaliphilum]